MRIANLLLIILLAIFSGCTSVEGDSNFQPGDRDIENDAAEAELTEGDLSDGDISEDDFSDGDIFEQELEEYDLADLDLADLDAEEIDSESIADGDNDSQFEHDTFENEQETVPPTPSCMAVEYAAPIKHMGYIAQENDKAFVTQLTADLDNVYKASLAIVDTSDEEADTIEIDSNIFRVFHAPHGLVAGIKSSGNLVFFDPDEIANSTDPLNEISCNECAFSTICFADNKAYWLSNKAEENSYRVMSGTIDDQGNLSYGENSSYFAMLEDKYFEVWQNSYTINNIVCNDNGIFVSQHTGLYTQNRSAAWKVIYISINADGSLQEPVVADEGGYYPSHPTMPITATMMTAKMFSTGTTLLADFVLGISNWPSGWSVPKKFLYDISTPGQTTASGEHELDMSTWHSLKNNTVWATENVDTTLKRHTLSEDFTVETVGQLENLNGIFDMDAHEDTAYLSLSHYGIQAVEIKPETEPQVVFDKQLSMDSAPIKHIFAYNGKTYIINSHQHIEQFQATHPLNPPFKVDLGLNPMQIIQQESLVYATAYSSQSLLLAIVDLDKPEAEALLFSGNLPVGSGQALGYRGNSVLHNNILYTAHNHLYAIDVSDATQPTVLWETVPYDMESEGRFDEFATMEIVNGQLVALAEDDNYNNRLSLLIFKPNAELEPTYLGVIDDIADEINVYGNKLLLAKQDYDHLTLRTMDFSLPNDPQLDPLIHRYDIRFSGSTNTYRSFFYSREYLVIVSDSLHLINPEDLSKDVYTIDGNFELNDIYPDNYAQDKFWISLATSRYSTVPTALFKVNLAGCQP